MATFQECERVMTYKRPGSRRASSQKRREFLARMRRNTTLHLEMLEPRLLLAGMPGNLALEDASYDIAGVRTPIEANEGYLVFQGGALDGAPV